MASYRRTLSMEDLVNASDDEMDNLLLEDKNPDEIVHHEHPGLNTNNNNNRRFENSSSNNASIGGNTDSAPILELGDDGESSINGEIKPTMPRSKSVRFQEPETSERGTDGDGKLNYVKVQVDQATGIMKDNLARLMEREASLESMSERADQLLYSSDIYHQSSEHLRRKMRWRQVRTRLFLSAVGIICVFLILVPFITKFV